MFKRITCKLGNMKKAVDFTIYPQKTDNPNEVLIQSDKRIAQIDLNTGKGVLSNGKGHPAFITLSPLMGATEIDVPAEIVAELKQIMSQK